VRGIASRRRTAAEEWFVYAETPGWGPTHVAGPFFTQQGAQEFIDMSPRRSNWFVTTTDYRQRDFSDVGPAEGEDWHSWLVRNNID
jgi:hypothetical protein